MSLAGTASYMTTLTSGGECSANVSCECAECGVWPNANAANANVDKCECECEYVRVCGHPSGDLFFSSIFCTTEYH